MKNRLFACLLGQPKGHCSHWLSNGKHLWCSIPGAGKVKFLGVKMPTKWWTNRDVARIDRVECERETNKAVWIKGTRRAKISTADCYHDTWEAAQEHLLNHAEFRVQSRRRSLEVANSFYGNVKGMRKPADVKG